MTNKVLQRDLIINSLIDYSSDNIKFITPDFGARPLDEYRIKNKDSFIYPGIAEQLSADIAYGIALGEGLPIVYGMSPFISARCFEQYKVLFGQTDLPICIMPVGVGLGYDHNTLSHYSLDDIGLYSSVPGLKIYTPYDCDSANDILTNWIDSKNQIVIRLERQAMPKNIIESTEEHLAINHFGIITQRGADKLIISWGYLGNELLASPLYHDYDVFLFSNFNFDNTEDLENFLKPYKNIIITEESFSNTGLASLLLPFLINLDSHIKLRHVDKTISKVRSHRSTLWEKYNLLKI